MNFATLAGLRSHLEIKHHIPGRIRIKFDLALTTDPTMLRMARDRGELPPGVRSARLNAMARSVVIEYDAEHIPPELLEELVTTRGQERAEALLRELDAILRNINA